MNNSKTRKVFGDDITAGRFGWFSVFLGWMRAHRLRKKLLIDMLFDLSAIDVLYAKPLAENEDELRNALMAARNRENPDEKEIQDISDRIAAMKSAREVREKTVSTIEEYRKYLGHLDLMAEPDVPETTDADHDVQG